MTEESFMLLSLKENQSKKLAQVIGNETCRAILEYLTEKEFSTESEVAKDLKIPLSTVHYNLRALLASGLVIADEYHYSDKGKEVPHYKLAKKFIIIAPKDERSVFDKLKKFIPVTAITVGLAAAYEFGRRIFSSTSLNTKMAVETAPAVANTTADTASRVMTLATPETIETVGGAGIEMARSHIISPIASYFLAGAFFVILAMVVYEFMKKK